MIRTRFAEVQPADWGCTVTFGDASFCQAQHWPESPHYRVIAHRCGYQDDTLRYAIEHEVAHLIVEEALHNRPSRVLWGLAHGNPLCPKEAAYEECVAQTLQAFVRANQRPIIGPGIDWDAIRARFEEVME
jgi:hypothetical protein